MIGLKLRLNKKINYNIGSRLQGYIMQNLNSDYVEFLHTQNYHPYTQYIERVDDNTSIWHLNLLDENAINNIVDIFKEGNDILLDNEEEFKIIGITKKEISKSELLKELSEIKPRKYVEICFITPTAFKTNEEYYYFPSIKLIFNSIINRYNLFSNEFTFEGVELIDDIVENFIISDYNIKTKRFYLENVKIKGFIGRITIKLGGPSQFVNIGNMLLKYAEYTGIGIKTSMGMGGMQIKQSVKRIN